MPNLRQHWSCLYFFSHPNGYMEIFHRGFNLLADGEYHFRFLFTTWISFIGNKSVQVLCSFCVGARC